MFRRSTAALVALFALAACEPAYSMGTPLTPTTETLVAASVVLAVPLADGSLLVDDGEVLAIAGPAGVEPIGVTGEVGELLAFAELDGSTLVAGTEGTFVVQTGDRAGIFRAPIETVIGEETIHAMATSPRSDGPSDLWVATDQSLYLFRDEILTEVRLTGIDLGGVQIASLGPLAIWAATNTALLQVRVAPDAVMLSATRIDRPAGATSIAVDGEGTLWLVTEGALASLRRDLRLDHYALPFAPSRVFASGDAGDVWIDGDAGFHHQLGRVFRAVEGVTLEDVVAGPEGTLFARGASVRRIRARHPIAVEGLHSGPILEATRVEVLLPSGDNVTAVRAHAGETELEVTGALGDPSAPPAFIIEPGPVPVGGHTLVVEADYDDGTLTATFRAPIEIATDATWTNDIEPIYLDACADCHGERGPSPTRLDAREDWVRLSARIIDNVQSGRMPLGRPMLPASDIALIQAWASGGFTE